MTREEQIIQASDEWTYQKPPQYSELVHKTHKVMCAYQVGFIDGAVWADEHPSDEVLCRFIQLYKEWFTNQNIEHTPLEYIKKYWDGNERNECANNSHRATKLSDIDNDPRGYDKEGGER